MTEYITRLVDRRLDFLLAAQPAVMIVGPRAAGKTTTATRRAATIVRLDRAAEAGAFEADPDAALRDLVEPVLLDEWQEVPGILGAIKRTVDADPHPGRFIITGSVRGDITGQTWPATGRVIRVVLHGMSVREQVGRLAESAFVDRLAAGEAIVPPANPPDLRGYVELALRGGFPQAWNQPDELREGWLQSYMEQLVTRDATSLGGLRDPSRLRRYVNAYAINSAGAVSDATLLEASGLDRKTAQAYERLLTDLFVVDPLPAWTSNRLQRLIHAPKRYFADPSLVGAVLRADVTTVMRDADLIGRLIDTFVVAQLRTEQEIASSQPVLYHARERQGRHEVDVLAEIRGGQVVAFEVKATAAPGASDAKHLGWLRDKLANRFAAGVLLHTGPSVFTLGDRLTAIPIAALWS